ncbi:transmembrane protein 179 isoform X2 [Strongylocentrotus purpuratus]|uniref:Uncharacterized protein n=1 Tax=Strongylocentrotus purpuratus TaxID=7668 RepID=A0A7M7GK81_STRPU|nr:transmembrane protein 179 isoform X2 [Strongylocentrotus purpuratus]|eukprot:XP_003729276.1 PREDICTED: transmembrane protein 179 isoform X2 [Strongylocentrotus purpuratus]
MAIQGVLAVTETVMYFVVGITGLVAAITVGISRDAFSNQCILYSEIKWCNDTAMGFTDLGSNTACSFAVGIEVIASLYAIVFGIYYALILVGKIEGIKYLTIPSIIFNVAFTLVLFVESCIVSVGFKQFCDGLTSGPHVKDCSKGSKVSNWNIAGACIDKGYVFMPHDTYNGDLYFGFYTTGQGASWFSFLFWMVIALMSIFRRFRDKDPVAVGSTEERKPMLT